MSDDNDTKVRILKDGTICWSIKCEDSVKDFRCSDYYFSNSVIQRNGRLELLADMVLWNLKDMIQTAKYYSWEDDGTGGNYRETERFPFSLSIKDGILFANNEMVLRMEDTPEAVVEAIHEAIKKQEQT